MSRKIDLEQNKQRKKRGCIRSLELDSSPLVWAQAAVCRRQERLQLRGEFIQLHGEGGEAVVQHVILRLGICRVTQVSEVSCCTNVTLGFMLISSFGDGRITLKLKKKQSCKQVVWWWSWTHLASRHISEWAECRRRCLHATDLRTGGWHSRSGPAPCPAPRSCWYLSPNNETTTKYNSKIQYQNTGTKKHSKRKAPSGTGSGFRHLDEGDLAGAGVALEVADGDLSVMLQVALLTEDVMDAGHHFVPLVVVAVPGQNNKIHRFIKPKCHHGISVSQMWMLTGFLLLGFELLLGQNWVFYVVVITSCVTLCLSPPHFGLFAPFFPVHLASFVN